MPQTIRGGSHATPATALKQREALARVADLSDAQLGSRLSRAGISHAGLSRQEKALLYLEAEASSA